MNKKAIVSLLAASVLLISSSLTAFAAVTSLNTNAPAKSQAKTNWCWAACSVSAVYAIRGVTIDQATYVTEATGGTDNAQKTTSQVKQYLKDVGGVTTTFYSTSTGGALTFSSIKSQINSNKPIYCKMFNISANSSHAVLITGVRYDPNDPGYQDVRVMDPWTGTFTYVEYSTFCDNYKGNSYWSETLHNMTK